MKRCNEDTSKHQALMVSSQTNTGTQQAVFGKYFGGDAKRFKNRPRSLYRNALRHGAFAAKMTGNLKRIQLAADYEERKEGENGNLDL